MNLADKLSEIDKQFPTGWTLERRGKHYNFTILESETQSVFCGDSCETVSEAIESALDKREKGIDFYSQLFDK